ncbi:MAG: bifunctional diguanylate cyclase/phosphodiesterase [Lachnospiraceae bacterium]|nr:bifunctional diguanylate cyclase/phosphodiesterase [Lachnospiraceae bacterium]
MDDLRYQVDLLTAKNQKLINNERMYNMICESSGCAFVYLNYVNNSIKLAGNWDLFFDFRISDLSEVSHLTDYFKEEDSIRLKNLLYIEKEGKDSATDEFELEGKERWVSVSVKVNCDDTGLPGEKLITLNDVSSARSRRDELYYMAYFDMLTGLSNRNHFITQLKDLLVKAERERTVVSVMLIDIDDFHKISDVRGILAGDEVIQSLGVYLKELAGPNIIASRFDSDLFCLAIYDPLGVRSIDKIYDSIRGYLADPIKLTDKSEVKVTVSVGVSEYPESAEDALSLINCAEIVMLKAKDSGKDTIKFFDNQILDHFLKDVEMETKLKEAVHDTNFFLNFQPQYEAEGKILRGVEALLRWRDKDGNLISPSVFIPVAEKNGMIVPIGDFVLEESIKAHAKWKKKFGCSLILSINISSIQYNRPDFVSKILSTVRKYDMDPEELELEITESVLIDDFALVISKMYELRDYGIKVSLDDFGTGFSSLSYLRGLPIDTLKIDKSFIDNLAEDKAAKVITESIINMSKRLGFKTVAEGVESLDQLDYLKGISCDLIQGFYLGRPMDSDNIEELLLRQM